jgi:ATP-dependent DNA helicase RecG
VAAAGAEALREALEALRRPLDFVARDDFANLDLVRDLGATLSTAARRLSVLVAAGRRKGLEAWARDVQRWEVLPRSERERLIAAGLRLHALVASEAPPSVRAIPVKREIVVAPTAGPPSRLARTLEGLPGVGPVTRQRLAERGLVTVGDVLCFLPRRWDDLRQVVPVRALVAGALQMTRGRVQRVRVIPAFRRRILEVTFVDDATADDPRTLVCRWFQFRGRMQERFPVGARFLVVGTPKPYKGALEMAHPETIPDGEGGEPGGVVRVRYPEIEGVPGRLVEKLCRAVAETCADDVPDGIPSAIAARHGLASQGAALRALHCPPPDLDAAALDALNEGTSPAQRRLVFDEFFFLQLGLAKRRGLARREPGIAFALPSGGSEAALRRFFAALPFPLTGAQRRAIDEIVRDVVEPHPMHRLLQGDVGAGKTVVAWAACELACAAGYQAAVMAPTEILAEQHGRTMEAWARATGRSLALLTASTPRPARESALALLAAGRLDVVVGTHALLAERVSFARLGLVVIDEQHRFGVAQRATLREKGGDGERAPHLLVMTATPIPRTLALTTYGDLDLTLLDEMPPGRVPPETKVLGGKQGRARAVEALRRAVAEGRQAYWVCPLVEESEKVDLADVTEAAEMIREALADLLDRNQIGVVHGRLPTVERDDVMRAFRDGRVRVLVATTVIEVGVDVPAASMMVIEGADRFGLAQLHQLRGRIGRGGGRSLCLLVPGPGWRSKRGDAGDRLAVMAETSDGFKVAEADLRIRGPGEIFGTRQAGLPRLRYADLVRDAELLRLARAEAFALLERDPDLAHHPTTREVLDARWASGALFGEEAG